MKKYKEFINEELSVRDAMKSKSTNEIDEFLFNKDLDEMLIKFIDDQSSLSDIILLLDRGAKCKNGDVVMELLYLTTRADDVDLFERLHKEYNIELDGYDNNSILKTAVNNNSTKIFNYLIENDVDINYDNSSMFRDAMRLSMYNICIRLLESDKFNNKEKYKKQLLYHIKSNRDKKYNYFIPIINNI